MSYSWLDYIKMTCRPRKYGQELVDAEHFIIPTRDLEDARKRMLGQYTSEAARYAPTPSLSPYGFLIAQYCGPQEGKVPDKPAYTSNGMNGFTEKGPDDNWDMSLGTLRGYRWWTWSIPAVLAGWPPEDETSDSENPDEAQFSRLRGANSMMWPDGRVEATCTRGQDTLSWDDLLAHRTREHNVPEYRVTCGCGFWAYWPPDSQSAVGGSGNYPNNGMISIPVFGAIKASGRVILGEKGFRSQYGEIEALCLPGEAIEAISWWHMELTPERRHSSGYPDLSDGGAYTFNSLTGRAYPGERPQPRLKNERAKGDTILARAAKLEHVLGKLYPSAKIMSSRDLLVRAFPPDPDYYQPPGIF